MKHYSLLIAFLVLFSLPADGAVVQSLGISGVQVQIGSYTNPTTYYYVTDSTYNYTTYNNEQNLDLIIFTYPSGNVFALPFSFFSAYTINANGPTVISVTDSHLLTSISLDSSLETLRENIYNDFQPLITALSINASSGGGFIGIEFILLTCGFLGGCVLWRIFMSRW